MVIHTNCFKYCVLVAHLTYCKIMVAKKIIHYQQFSFKLVHNVPVRFTCSTIAPGIKGLIKQHKKVRLLAILHGWPSLLSLRATYNNLQMFCPVKHACWGTGFQPHSCWSPGRWSYESALPTAKKPEAKYCKGVGGGESCHIRTICPLAPLSHMVPRRRGSSK